MHKLILSFKGRILKVYSPQDMEFSIGSQPECDMPIDNLAVAPVHARVFFRGHKAHLKPAFKDNKVLINNKIIFGTDEVQLARGDELQIGKHTITYLWESNIHPQEINHSELQNGSASRTEHRPEQKPLSRPALNGWLQVMNGPRMGRTLQLDKPNLRIGSSKEKSALISNRDDGYYLTSLNKDINISVNEQRVINYPVHLQDGHTIQVDDMTMLFFIQD